MVSFAILLWVFIWTSINVGYCRFYIFINMAVSVFSKKKQFAILWIRFALLFQMGLLTPCGSVAFVIIVFWTYNSLGQVWLQKAKEVFEILSWRRLPKTRTNQQDMYIMIYCVTLHYYSSPENARLINNQKTLNPYT